MIISKSNLTNILASDKTAFVLLVPIFSLLLCYNLFIPLWGNMLLAFGAFNQAEYHWTFPESIFYADYLRGGFYKFVIYFIYKLVSLFVNMEQYYVFQFATKLIYYSVCITFTYFSFKIGKPKEPTKKRLLFTGFIWCIILSAGYRQFMESEELAAILVIGHTLFILSPYKWANALSGVFLFMLFGCKAITIVYAAFGPLYWLFFAYDKSKLKLLSLSHVGLLFLTIIVYLTLLKPEWINITTAMSYQNSSKFNGLLSVQKFINAFIRFSYYQPTLMFIPLGLIVALFINRKVFLFILITSFIAALCVILQNRFSSPYHFLSFLPLIIFLAYKLAAYQRWLVFAVMVFPLYYTIKQNHATAISYPKSSNLLYKNYFNQQCKNYAAINSKIDSSTTIENDTILFLTGDCPPYFLTRPNANTMVGALLLNRGMYRPKLKESPAYKELQKNIEKYSGRFILYDPEYLPIDSFPFIRKALLHFDTLMVSKNSVEELGETQLILFKRKNGE